MSSSAVLKYVKISLACIIAGLLLWWTSDQIYFGPARDLSRQIENASSIYKTYQKEKQREVAQVKDLDALGARSIGANEPDAEHTLRTRLNEIAATAGLRNIRVNTQNLQIKPSPAARFMASIHMRDLSKTPDWGILPGDLAGMGTLDEVVRTVEAIEGEPYLKRITSMSIVPRKGDQFELTVKLEALLIPDAKPEVLPDPMVPTKSAYAEVIEKNVFRVPPAPQLAQADPPPVVHDAKPTPPPPPPWEDWTVTGIVRLNDHPEIWFRNLKTSESLHLVEGQEILKAKIEQIGTDHAVVSIDGQKFMVEIGHTLQDRKPVSQ